MTLKEKATAYFKAVPCRLHAETEEVVVYGQRFEASIS
jgi:hypothetical protein